MPYPLKATDEKQTLQKTTIQKLVGGLNLLEREDQLDPSETQRCRNVILKESRAYQDTGYTAFADAILGTPQATYQFFKKSGVGNLMLVTTVSVYRYATTVDQWQYVKGTAGTTLTAQANAGATSLTVASIAGFSNGDKVGVTLDNGVQHRTSVNGVPAGSTIVILDAIPVGRNAPNGAALVRAVVLAGNLDKHVVVDTVPSHDWFVFTNGVDRPKRYDGADCVDIPNLPSGGNTICLALRLYNKALFLLNTTEGGTAFPQRARRSDIGDPTNWTTGTAGFDDLYDDSDFILAGEILGPYLVVYRERSIERGEFIGQGGINYSFQTMIKGEGASSTLGVVDMGDYHILLGNANIYEYRAGFDLDPIGDKIHPLLFGPGADVNPTNRKRSFAFFVEELNEAWFFLPTSLSPNCDRLLRYNISEENFAERVFAHKFVGYGFFQKQDTIDWAGLVGAWSQQTWFWGTATTLEDSPTTHLCADTTGLVYEYDYVSTSDAGTAVSFILETKDFLLSEALLRLDTVEGFLRGSGVLIEFSSDEGATWNTVGTVTNTTNKKFLLGKQGVMQRIRFRFSGSDPQFMLTFFEFYWRLETPR
ncbi:MAG: hypothetical protein L0312_05645 [Acidobacteria bacterium]|nr:hypothetical protein [Acidobacteriota bacterium]